MRAHAPKAADGLSALPPVGPGSWDREARCPLLTPSRSAPPNSSQLLPTLPSSTKDVPL